MLKNLATLLLVMSCCTLLRAQSSMPGCNLVLNGLVVDQDNGLPIPGATIFIAAQNRTVLSSEKGTFVISGLCKSRIELKISSVGYTSHTQKLTLTRNRTLTVNLHAANITLGEIEVSGHRKHVNTANNSQSIRGRDLEMLRGQSLAVAVKDIPGVNMLQTGATIAKPIIHGLHSNRILTLNNGLRQEGQQWGSEHAPEIDPFIAQKITVIKGSEGIRYGADALGGVIIVEPAPLPANPAVHGEINLAGAQNGRAGIASATVSGGLPAIPGLGWRIQGSAKKAGNMRTADYYLDNTGLREHNFSAATAYTTRNWDAEIYYSQFKTEIGILKDAHIGNINDLIARIEFGRPYFDKGFTYDIAAPMQKIRHDLLKIKTHIHLRNDANLNLTYGFQHNDRREYDQRRVLSGTPTLSLRLNTHTLDANYEHLSAAGWKKIIGAGWISQVNNNEAGTGVIPLIPNFDSYSANAYAILRRLGPTWETEAGVRYDYKYLDARGYNRQKELYGGTHHFNNVSANIGGVKHFSNGWHLRSNVGLAWRPPAVNELYSNGLHHGTASYEIGDSTLVSEKSVKWLSALERKTDTYSLSIDAYLNYIKDFIFLKPSGEYFQNIRGAFPIFRFNQTNARLWGIDVAGSVAISHRLEYGLKASMIRGTDQTNNTYLPWIPSDRLQNSLKLGLGDTRIFKESFMELRSQLVTRQTRYVAGSDFMAPPGAYHLLGATVSTLLRTGKSTVLLSLTGENITNKLYREYLNRFRYFAHETGRNMTLRATWKF